MWTNQNSGFLADPHSQPRSLQTLDTTLYTKLTASTTTNSVKIVSALGAFIAMSTLTLIAMSIFLLLRVHFWKKPRVQTKREIEAALSEKQQKYIEQSNKKAGASSAAVGK